MKKGNCFICDLCASVLFEDEGEIQKSVEYQNQTLIVCSICYNRVNKFKNKSGVKSRK